MKIVKKHIRKTDAVTALLWAFILFIIVLFVYISKVDNHIESYSHTNDKIHELETINKDLNNFLLQQTTFIDYDNINKKISTFSEGIEFLHLKSSPYVFSAEYNELVKDVDDAYKQKVDAIEYFKSESAQFLYSMHYLYDLNDVISKSKELDNASINAANDSLLGLMKYSVNANIETKDISKNLNILNTKDNDYTKMFVRHTKIDLKRIKKFNEIKNSQVEDATLIALDRLHAFINEDYQENILVEKIIVTVLFVVALVILLTLIIMNKRSLRI